MVSDFLVQHPDGPFFELSENEWERAIEKYRALATTDNVGYIPRTATASLSIGTDGYFDNETILCQFERLFQLIEFKEDYKNRQIEILVDNARTHTAKSYSLQDFGKNIGTRCPVEQIEYVDDHGSRKVLDCYFKDGPNKGKSKGLVELCRDLGVVLPQKIKLHEVRETLAKHPAFQNVSMAHFIIKKESQVL